MSAVNPPSSPSLALSPGIGVTLQPGQARTVRVPATGVLRVMQGALWVTRRGTHTSDPPDDLHMVAGQPLTLRAGDAVVIEPIHLMPSHAARVAPATFVWQPASGRCAGALRWFAGRLGTGLHGSSAHA